MSVSLAGFVGSFSYTTQADIDEEGTPYHFPVSNKRLSTCSNADFAKIPGSPLAYWASSQVIDLFGSHPSLSMVAPPRQGLATSDNTRFSWAWPEVSQAGLGFGLRSRSDAIASGKKWIPYDKGGDYRKWYGNNEYLINWLDDGKDVKEFIKDKNPYVARGETHYFEYGVTYTNISSSRLSCRFSPEGFIFDQIGSKEQSRISCRSRSLMLARERLYSSIWEGSCRTSDLHGLLESRGEAAAGGVPLVEDAHLDLHSGGRFGLGQWSSTVSNVRKITPRQARVKCGNRRC